MGNGLFEMMKNAPRHHKLLTKALEKKLPEVYSTEGTPTKDKMLAIKFFSPYSNWTWYGVEYDRENKEFFGFVVGDYKEWGYFSLIKLEELGGNVERDLYFSPKKFSEMFPNECE